MRLKHALILSLGLIAPTLTYAAETDAAPQSAPVAGDGIIAGRVVDASTGKGISGVSVSVLGPNLYTTSDVDGKYRVSGIPAGAQTVTFYKGGYDYSQMKDIAVPAGDVARADISLNARAYEEEDEFGVEGDIIMLDAIVVVAEQMQDSQIGLQQYRSKSLNVSDAIGAEDFTKQGLGDAAEAMGRVTGASVMEGKYVLIRGLGDRYANTQMNGVSMPSADPDKRAVQMDQFPTDLLESIQTSKSFTPDLPGDFAGGSVNIRTKSFPEQFFATLSVSTGYNSNVTGKDILSSEEGLSFFGMDADDRTAPETPEGLVLPQTAYNKARANTNPSLESAILLSEFSKQFQHSMFPKTRNGLPNYGFSIATGNQYELGKERRLGYTFSFTYDRKTEGFDDGYLASYTSLDTAKFIYDTDPSNFSFSDRLEGKDLPWGDKTPWGYTKSVQSINWGVFSKIALQTSANNEITLDLYHNQYAEDEVRRGVGVQPEDYPSMIFENYSLLYTERGMSSAQLHGKHLLPSLKDAQVEWHSSWSRSTQKQPDFRVFQTLYDLDNESYSTNTTYPPSRYFRDLDEESLEGGADISLPFKFFGEMESTIKFGGLYSTTDRTYSEDQYTVYYGRGSTAITSWAQESSMFTDGTIGLLGSTDNGKGGWITQFGWTVYPVDTYVSNYKGEQDIGAAYLMGDILFSENWRLVAGARAESTDLSVSTFKASDGTLDRYAEIDQTDVLPAVSLIYTFREGMNLRFAYGSTIARPTFKELTSARLYDPFRREYYQGNPDLKMTSIDNLDLRWEWFMDKGSMVAVSAFYKTMDDPIEVMFMDSTDGTSTGTLVISPVNRDEAEVKGVEAEVRYSLEPFASWLEGVTVGGNFSLIDADVSGGEYHGEVIPDTAMVGQSRYVANANISYQNFSWGSTITLALNKVGERLVAFTPPDDELPDVYEQPPVTLNLIYSQKLWSGVSLKLGFSNLLNSEYKRTLGKDSDVLMERYRKGRSVSMSLSYSY
ncbi:MAG: TonB-dependent receptor [Opitutales bacterium]|nr:TonB-dependent receptor [Opitutales bacterium]